MSRSLKSYWINNVELSPLDRKRLVYFVHQELNYYNNLVSVFAGPMRSMPETFEKTASCEDLLGAVAEHAIDLETVRRERAPAALKPFEDTLYDQNGRVALDSRLMLLAKALAGPATLDRRVRRNIALTVLRECRAQSRALRGADMNGGMPSIIETLSPIDATAKRHVQIPRNALQVDEDGKHDLVVTVPYFGAPLRVSKPNASWNYAYARLNHDGQISFDLAFEDAPYVLRKTDRGPDRKQPGLARRGVRQE